MRARSFSKARALVAAGLLLSGNAHAGGPLGAPGTRIGTSKYSVDLFQGPVLATTRIIGLGGAYTAIAEDTDGIPFNPAAASFRPGYSTTKADYDLTAGLTLPNSVAHTDFDNNGKVGFTYDNFYWLTFGGIIYYGHFGIGLIGAFQNYEIGVPGAVALPDTNEVIGSVQARILRLDPVVSYGFLRDQLHLGVGLRFTGFYGVANAGLPGQDADNERLLVNANTTSFQVGGLWAPEGLPFRVGTAIRSPSIPVVDDDGRIPKDANGDRVVGNLYLPERVELPWEAEAGFAIQLWKRPLNIPWIDEDKVPVSDTERWRKDNAEGQPEPASRGARRMLKARYKDIPRQRVLLSFSTLVSGAVPNAVGVESMLSQMVDRSGQRAAVTLRGGAEAEVVPNWLVLRAGSYLEPTRYREGATRLHGTGGGSFRVYRGSIFGLFDPDSLFRVSLAIDVGRDYVGWGLSAGLFR